MTFRILALDGGGIRGAYSAALLAEVEESTGKRFVDHFDLIAGTSTGGIIAIGLGLGLTASEILSFYRERGADIFPSTGVHQRLWTKARRLVKPKFGAEALDDALTSVFGDRLLGESQCRLLIPSYDAVRAIVHVFKTRHDARVLRDHTRRAAEVARATSAAPTYLPMYPSSWGQKFLDGGVWANCPAAIAVLEAVAVLGVPLPDIRVLNIGTTTEAFSIDRQAEGGGLLQYGISAIDLLQQAQAVSAVSQAQLLLRTDGASNFERIDTTVRPKRFSLDDARGIANLIALGVADGRHNAERLAARYMATPVSRFVPVP